MRSEELTLAAICLSLAAAASKPTFSQPETTVPRVRGHTVRYRKQVPLKTFAAAENLFGSRAIARLYSFLRNKHSGNVYSLLFNIPRPPGVDFCLRFV